MRPALLALLAALAGCSLVMRTGRFEPPRKPYCHRWVHPIADTLVAGATATAAVALELADREQDGLEPTDNTLGTVILAGVALLYVTSAVVGYKRSLRCAEEHRAYEQWRREQRARDAHGE